MTPFVPGKDSRPSPCYTIPDMHREGHYGVALLAYTPLGVVATIAGGPQLALLGGAGALALAMLPDQDQRVPGLEHRGPTHTIWFALLVGAVCGAAGGTLGAARGDALLAVGLGLFAGLVGLVTMLAHIAADALTPAGVRPLAPVDDRHVSYDVARAANPLANYALLAVGVVVAGGAYLVAAGL